MGQHVAVVTTLDEDHLLPLHIVRSQEVEVDAERLMANLREEILMVTEFAVDPLPLDDRAGVVLDGCPQLVEAALRDCEGRLEWMSTCHSYGCITGIDVALGDVAGWHEARTGGCLGREWARGESESGHEGGTGRVWPTASKPASEISKLMYRTGHRSLHGSVERRP